MVANRSTHSRSYDELLEALGERGCPICWLGRRVSERYLDGVLYEAVNDPGMRERFREAYGLCEPHARQLARIRSGNLGIAILYRDVLWTLLRELGDEEGQPRRYIPWPRATAEPFSWEDRLVPRGRCPACVQQEEMERIYIHELLQHLEDPALHVAFLKSTGLCLKHLRRAMQQAGKDQQRQALIEMQRTVWRQLVAELDEFIRKHDYRFRDEGFGPEGDSWLRALIGLTGAI
ncbi:MAG TPA: hypothetical protein G4O02_05975 [Caldilineae bacterium]|nr:hypothetical protein [Caldilineae bacterium]